jgi:hypothetical protein
MLGRSSTIDIHYHDRTLFRNYLMKYCDEVVKFSI